MSPWRNVHMIGDTVMMIYGTSCVYDDVSPDNASRIDDRTCTDQTAGPYLNVRCDDGPGVNGRHQMLTAPTQSLIDFTSSVIISNSHDDCIVRDLIYLGERTPNGQPQSSPTFKMGSVVQITDRYGVITGAMRT
jgi:hypothetical protein